MVSRMDMTQWWQRANFYQVYPRSFLDTNGDGIGDLKGITRRLDYLKSLGIDAIWLCPVYDSPNDDNGYDIRDYYRIHEEFGTMKDMDRLIADMKKRDMKLVMDLVVNHCSDEHAWFSKARQSRTDPFHEYFIWHPGRGLSEPSEAGSPIPPEPNNWGSHFGGSAWEWNEPTREYYLHLFSRKQPDLNWENSALRQDIYKMMRFWLNKGVGGFRMDVINYISKDPDLPDVPAKDGQRFVLDSRYYANRERTHEHLQEMHREVLSRYPDCMTIGEMHQTSIDEGLKYVHPERHELSMIFQFEHLSLDSGPRGKYDLPVSWDLPELKKTLSRWQKDLFQHGWNSLYTGNHDQPRMLSRLGITDTNEMRKRSAKAIAAAFLLMQGTPFVYQGEEIGMTNVAFPSVDLYRDIETLNFYREAVEQGMDTSTALEIVHLRSRDNSRTPMQWNSDAHGGFTAGRPWISLNPNYPDINVRNDSRDPDGVHAFFTALLKQRHDHKLWTEGAYEDLAPEHPQIICYVRRLESGEAAYVIVNLSGSQARWDPPSELSAAYAAERIVLASPQPPGTEAELSTLEPMQVIVCTNPLVKGRT